MQPGDVIERHARELRAAGIDAARGAAGRPRPPWARISTPQALKSGSRSLSRRPARRVVAVRMHLLGLGMRIDEDQRLAAAEHELVDGVERLVRQVLRMHDHQHVDVVGSTLSSSVRERAQLVELAQLVDDRIGHASAGPASPP